MRKKWIILAVILVLTLTLAMGCGKDDKNKTSGNSGVRENTVAENGANNVTGHNDLTDRAKTDAEIGREEVRDDMQDLREDMRDTVQDTLDMDDESRLDQNVIDEENAVNNDLGRTNTGLFGFRDVVR